MKSNAADSVHVRLIIRDRNELYDPHAQGIRGGKVVSLKATVDDALGRFDCPSVKVRTVLAAGAGNAIDRSNLFGRCLYHYASLLQRVLVYKNTNNANVYFDKHRDDIWQDVMVRSHQTNCQRTIPGLDRCKCHHVLRPRSRGNGRSARRCP